MKTKKLKPTTVADYIREKGAPAIARALEVDPSLPNKWAKGQRPRYENAEQLAQLAKADGFDLTVAAILKGGAQ